MRGMAGAYATAVQALEFARQSDLYPYIVAVATHEFLREDHFWTFMRFARDVGALEVHVLEPSATGRLTGRQDILLDKSDRQQILRYQHEVAERDDLPILSCYAYLESPDAFGCGAGLTHLYIDGSGEVCPCNLVPMSFGNVTTAPLASILDRMGSCFREPRCACVGRVLSRHIPLDATPTLPMVSERICAQHLRQSHPVPRFFEIRAESQPRVGPDEVRVAYDRIGSSYDEFWLCEADKPIRDVVGRLDFAGVGRVLDAGCGTGFTTALVAESLRASAEIVAVDLSDGMLAEARARVSSGGHRNVRFVVGDAMDALDAEGAFDLIVTSWVLGYIPLGPFFEAAGEALSPSGRLAFVVHKADSPYEPLRIFGELVAEDPSVLEKHVAFEFPRDMDRARREVEESGMLVDHLWEGQVTFRYDSAAQVLEHLIKSGAGAAFYDAIAPSRRDTLTEQFLSRMEDTREPGADHAVVHDYISCIARKSA